MPRLVFQCPSCKTKLAAIESSDSATQINWRTCKGCKERWQLKTVALRVSEDVRMDKAEFTFLGRKS